MQCENYLRMNETVLRLNETGKGVPTFMTELLLESFQRSILPWTQQIDSTHYSSLWSTDEHHFSKNKSYDLTALRKHRSLTQYTEFCNLWKGELERQNLKFFDSGQRAARRKTYVLLLPRLTNDWAPVPLSFVASPVCPRRAAPTQSPLSTTPLHTPTRPYAHTPYEPHLNHDVFSRLRRFSIRSLLSNLLFWCRHNTRRRTSNCTELPSLISTDGCKHLELPPATP